MPSMTTFRSDSPLRTLRLSLPIPATLEQVAQWVRGRGLRCTAGHLSAVERGIKPPGPKLRAVLAAYYERTPAQMERVFSGTLHRRRRSA